MALTSARNTCASAAWKMPSSSLNHTTRSPPSTPSHRTHARDSLSQPINPLLQLSPFVAAGDPAEG